MNPIKLFLINCIKAKNSFSNLIEANIKLMRICSTKKNRIFILGAPYHSNLGDQAQTYCIEKWSNDNFPDYKTIVFTTQELNKNNYKILKNISKMIRVNDFIFIQSGYNTTDIYIGEENLHRKIMQTIKNNKIVFFPQTIFFKCEKEKAKTMQIYNSNNNAVFLARDKISYETALEMFNNLKVLLYPDIVTSLIGSMAMYPNKEGILFCIRDDPESFIDRKDIYAAMQQLSKKCKVDITDTTLKVKSKNIIHNRYKYIAEALGNFKKFNLIITDRYHGTIFSLVTNTPVIILPTSDHKLSSGRLWFESIDEYNDYVYYCDDLEKLETIVDEVMDVKNRKPLSKYFLQEYYDKLTSYLI